MLKALSYNTSLNNSSPKLAFESYTPIATNPAYAANLYIGVFRPDGTSGNISYRFNVQMWMNSQLTSKIRLGPS